jgi:RimJ/RimL family protein N-acetyltransferase
MTIDFSSDLILENDRVVLQPLKESDQTLLLKFSLQEPELWKYSLVSAAGQENLKNYIAIALKDRMESRSYPFLVLDKLTNEIAGSTRFYDYQPHHNTIQLGFTWYGKKFQGTGLNKNCKFLMLSQAFDVWNLDRVEFRADNNNARSIAAMKSIGCTPEGVLRSNCASLDGRRDSIVLSILKHEWHESVKENLKMKLNELAH